MRVCTTRHPAISSAPAIAANACREAESFASISIGSVGGVIGVISPSGYSLPGMGTDTAAGIPNRPAAPAPHENAAAARAEPAGSAYSVYTLRFRVRYAETDAMRVAHHAAYAVWLEAGRVEWIRRLGFPFAEVEASGYGHVVRELRIRYHRAVRFDQELALRIALASARGPRLTFGYRLYDAQELDADPDGAPPVALAATEMVWIDAAGRPTRLPAGHALARTIAGLQRYPDWASW